MAYRVIKTVKNRKYLYEQSSRREGKKVRTRSRYIGPAGGIGGCVGPNEPDHGSPAVDMDRWTEAFNEQHASKENAPSEEGAKDDSTAPDSTPSSI